jgi:hypothetical protein
MFWARCRFPCSASTCSFVQQTLVSFHSSPHTETSLSLKPLSGVSASPLSGHGSSEPNSDCLPQCPLMAQRPASCLSVVGLLLAASAVPSSHGAHVDGLITGRRSARGTGVECYLRVRIQESKGYQADDGMAEWMAKSTIQAQDEAAWSSRDGGNCFPAQARHSRLPSS